MTQQSQLRKHKHEQSHKMAYYIPELIVLLVSLTNHPSLLIAHHNIIAFSYFLGSSLKFSLVSY